MQDLVQLQLSDGSTHRGLRVLLHLCVQRKAEGVLSGSRAGDGIHLRRIKDSWLRRLPFRDPQTGNTDCR